jgi:hypothetical protein
VFRLTYLNKYQTGEMATNEWSRIETTEEAERLARNARNPRIKKQKTSAEKPTNSGAGKPTTRPQFHGGETRTTAIVGEPTLLSISPGDQPVSREWSTPMLTEYVGVSRAALLSAFKLLN